MYRRGICLLIAAISSIFLIGCATTLEDIETWKVMGHDGVAKLIKALKDEDFRIRCEAAKALGEIGDARAMDPLIFSASSDESEDVKKASEEAIVAIASMNESALDSLVQRLQHDDMAVRRTSARILLEITELDVTSEIINVLEEENPLTRRKAARALGETEDPRAMEFLIFSASSDESEDVKMVSEEAIVSIASMNESAMDSLVQRLYHDDMAVRRTAARILFESMNLDVVSELVESLEGENPLIRQKAAKALGEIGDAKAMEPLILSASSDESEDVKKASEEAIVSIASMNESALDSLVQKLQHDDMAVSHTVAGILEKIADPSARKALEELRDYKEAESQSTIASYQGFLSKHADGIFAGKAKVNLEDLEYKEAESQNTFDSYKEFLRKYPDSHHNKEAQAKLDWLEKDAQGLIHYGGDWYTKEELKKKISSAKRWSAKEGDETAEQIISRLIEQGGKSGQSSQAAKVSELLLDMMSSEESDFHHTMMDKELREFIESAEGKTLEDIMLLRGLVPFYGRWVTPDKRDELRQKMKEEAESISGLAARGDKWTIWAIGSEFDSGPLTSGTYGINRTTTSLKDAVNNVFFILELKLLLHDETKRLEYYSEGFVLFDQDGKSYTPIGTMGTMGSGSDFWQGSTHTWVSGYSSTQKLVYIIPINTELLKLKVLGVPELEVYNSSSQPEPAK